MGDTKETIWKADPHTFAKHDILKLYMRAWTQIHSKQLRKNIIGRNRLLFVDAFAGPGVYEDNQKGSPLVALDEAINLKPSLAVPILFYFLESRKDRFEILDGILSKEKKQYVKSQNILDIIWQKGECEPAIRGIIGHCIETGSTLGPAFFFLDQFGYSDVSMELIADIMGFPKCEVFSYLNWQRLNQFLSDSNKASTINRAFGGDEWRQALRLRGKDRQNYVLETYKSALKTKAKSRYVWHFKMINKNNNLIYWLFFCTNHGKGLLEMKRSMWKVDETGSFRFSDRKDQNQLYLFKSYDDDRLIHDLLLAFKGQNLKIVNIDEYLLTETPAYKWGKALKKMEDNGNLIPIEFPSVRRKGSFKHKNMVVKITSG